MNTPKLIDKWFDKPNNIHNYLYRCDNGVRILVSDNPATIECDLSVVLQSGSYFERKVGVPQGTAHFLEHMMSNPNAEFKSREAMDKFLFGNRTRPTLHRNAATSRKYVYYYVHGNAAGIERMIQYLDSVIHYPAELFATNIDKERSIILAEWQRLPKPEKNQAMQFEKFILAGTHPEFSEAVLGTDETINAITVEHLIQYYHTVFAAGNVMIAVQMPGKPSATLLRKFARLGSGFTESQDLPKDPEGFTNGFRFQAFNEPKEQGLSMSINYLAPRRKDFDYTEQVLYVLMHSLIHKVGLEVFREKLGLVYGVGATSFGLTWEWLIRGYRMTCDPAKALELLNYNLKFWNMCLEFLDSAHGRMWFSGQISAFIFPQTTQFDDDYAESTAADVLAGKYRYISARAIAAARQVQMADLKAHISTNFQHTPPSLWVVSSQPVAEVEELVRSSDFYKYWQDKPAVRLD